MEIRLRQTGEVLSESSFRASFPNTSLPQVLSSVILDALDADPVMNGPQPTSGRYEIVFRDGVEEIDGKWFTKYSVVEMNEEAKAAVDEQQASSVRYQRNQKLSSSDWTQVADAPVDQAAWANYRQALRDLTEQSGFPWDVQWPSEPS